MNAEFYKCQLIKKLIEQAAKVQDIGERNRKRPFPELRKIYSKLCKEFTNASLATIGQELGMYDHTSTINAIETFDNLHATNGLDLIHVYESIFHRLSNDKQFLNDNRSIKKKLTLPEIEQKYRIKLIKIIDKNHSIINKKNARIKELENLLNKNLIY